MRKRKQNKRQTNSRLYYEQFIADFDAAIGELIADGALEEEQVMYLVMSNTPS